MALPGRGTQLRKHSAISLSRCLHWRMIILHRNSHTCFYIRSHTCTHARTHTHTHTVACFALLSTTFHSSVVVSQQGMYKVLTHESKCFPRRWQSHLVEQVIQVAFDWELAGGSATNCHRIQLLQIRLQALEDWLRRHETQTLRRVECIL